MKMTRDLFKKIRDIKGVFQARMGMIKDKKRKDLKESEEVNKRWQEQIQILYKKGLNNWDNHNGVITQLEPDILEYEVKWALQRITINKASGDNGNPAVLFQILKDDVVKYCTQYTSKFGKLSSGHRAVKGQFSFQSKERQCQRMFKLPYGCTHFTCQ